MGPQELIEVGFSKFNLKFSKSKCKVLDGGNLRHEHTLGVMVTHWEQPWGEELGGSGGPKPGDAPSVCICRRLTLSWTASKQAQPAGWGRWFFSLCPWETPLEVGETLAQVAQGLWMGHPWFRPGWVGLWALVWLKCSCPQQEGWNKVILKFPSNQNNYVILLFSLSSQKSN